MRTNDDNIITMYINIINRKKDDDDDKLEVEEVDEEMKNMSYERSLHHNTKEVEVNDNSLVGDETVRNDEKNGR